MPDYPYLIIGGGMAAGAALKGIRQADMMGAIGVISGEDHPPYKRPPLSKGLWKGDPQEKIWMKLPIENVNLHLTRIAARIDPQRKQVTDNKGIVYGFEKLLLATGGRVRTFPWNVEGIIYYRTFDDYQRLKEMTQSKNDFVVIGGGFIGSEVAAALSMNGKKVTLLFPDSAIGARIYPADLSQFLNTYFREKGVEIMPNDGVDAITRNGEGYTVVTKSGKTLVADGVVAGLGIEPNVELAVAANIEVHNGIVISEFCRTNLPDIYAAGDAASFHNSLLDKRMRVEHEDNAVKMGEIAGKNMAGPATPYDYLPFFYSDLFDLGYEAVGETDSRFETVADWKKEFNEGVVYYLNGGRVRGVLLWNTWGQVENARKLIGEPGPFTAANLKGRLPQ